MSTQDQKPENEKEPMTSETTSKEEEQDKDELPEEALDEASGGLIWQISPTSGNGQYTNPVPWKPIS